MLVRVLMPLIVTVGATGFAVTESELVVYVPLEFVPVAVT